MNHPALFCRPDDLLICGDLDLDRNIRPRMPRQPGPNEKRLLYTGMLVSMYRDFRPVDQQHNVYNLNVQYSKTNAPRPTGFDIVKPTVPTTDQIPIGDRDATPQNLPVIHQPRLDLQR